MSIEEQTAIRQHSYNEALRYLENAKETYKKAARMAAITKVESR